MSYQNQPMQNDPYKSQGRKSTMMIAIGGIVLVLLAGFALGAGGLVGLGNNNDEQYVQQGSTDPNNLLQGLSEGRTPSTLQGSGLGRPLTQQASQGSAALTQSTDTGFIPPILNQGYDPAPPVTQQYDKMPADVRAWLEHLAYTESERKRLATNQLGMFTTQMTSMAFGGGAAYKDLIAEANGEESTGSYDPNQNYDPGKRDKVETDTKSARQSWKDINTYFNSKPTPTECIPIKNSYEQCLGETSAMMRDVLDALDSSHTNPQSALQTLMGMLGTSQGKIDVPADLTDKQVNDICRKYETYKWFSVSGDFGGGMGALGGLGGLAGGLDLSDIDLSGLLGG